MGCGESDCGRVAYPVVPEDRLEDGGVGWPEAIVCQLDRTERARSGVKARLEWWPERSNSSSLPRSCSRTGLKMVVWRAW